MTFYVVIPYNDYSEIMDELLAYSDEHWLALEYAKEWDCYRIDIVEYEAKNNTDMYKMFHSEFDMNHLSPSDEIEKHAISHKPIERYYLYTDSQFLMMTEYNVTIAEEYLYEVLHSIYWVLVLADYSNDLVSTKLNTVVKYLLYKYIIRVILVSATDVTEFQDFIKSSGMTERELFKYKDEYIVSEEDVLNMSMVIKQCLTNMYKPSKGDDNEQEQ